MAAIPGQLDAPREKGNRRSSQRRVLHLQAQETSRRGVSDVVILDIANTGLLLQTSGRLSVDETIELELPGGSTVAATVRWASGRLYGCAFAQPVSDAFVSAALLRSPPLPGRPVSEQGPMDLAAEATAQDPVGRLSGRARVAVVIGLALLSWAIVAAPLIMLI